MGTMSRPGTTNFFKQSQVMISTKLPVSTWIRRMIALVIFISTTRGSLWGEVNRGESFPPNIMVGVVMHDPYSTDLPRAPKLGFPRRPSYVRRIAARYGGDNLCGPLLISRRRRGLLVSLGVEAVAGSVVLSRADRATSSVAACPPCCPGRGRSLLSVCKALLARLHGAKGRHPFRLVGGFLAMDRPGRACYLHDPLDLFRNLTGDSVGHTRHKALECVHRNVHIMHWG
ncbi:LOW QUALITY PROTEIN: hypothetical protein Cgig2_021193 [Carnegiea gigantea]|uniref:Uncharacterized protein n=1 Tax=Carnegiea gigantea TaxID=171969 RepID=A0A9Q1QR84_9CARY|nr:LOW QUALITY PROTEIN: hypothetical protein Cgig2_021193 [Carnegiea gigantea]